MQLRTDVQRVPFPVIRLGQNAARLKPHPLELVSELADAIEETQWVEPLVVERHWVDGAPARVESYVLVAGYKRQAALALLIRRGKLPADTPVPVLVVPRGTPINVVENLHRTPMDPIALVEAIERFLASGRTQTQVAKLIGRNKSQVSRYAGIRQRLAPDVWAKLHGARTTLAELTEISWLPARKQRLRVGLDPITGPKRPPVPSDSRTRPRRVTTIRQEIRRISQLPRTREQQIALKALQWAICQRQELPI